MDASSFAKCRSVQENYTSSHQYRWLQRKETVDTIVNNCHDLANQTKAVNIILSTDGSMVQQLRLRDSIIILPQIFQSHTHEQRNNILNKSFIYLESLKFTYDNDKMIVFTDTLDPLQD